jgi:hypothetical protein
MFAAILAIGEIATATKLLIEHFGGFVAWVDHLNAWQFFFWLCSAGLVWFAGVCVRDWLNERFDDIGTQLKVANRKAEENKTWLHDRLTAVEKIVLPPQ